LREKKETWGERNKRSAGPRGVVKKSADVVPAPSGEKPAGVCQLRGGIKKKIR